MAININEWTTKYPEINKETIINWITDISIKGIPINEQEEAMKKKYEEHTGIRNEEEDKEEIENYKENHEEDYDTQETNNNFNEEETPINLQEEIENYKENHEEDYDTQETNNNFNEEETPINLQEEIKKAIIEEDNHEEESQQVPFNNPDLSDLEVPDETEEDYEEDYEEPIIPRPRIQPPKRKTKTEMITKNISIEEYDEIMRPWKPLFADLRNDSNMLIKLASQINNRYMPPYMQLKQFIINNPIKDQTNTQVQISVISETNPKQIEPKFVSLNQAHEITKMLAEAGWLKESLLNFDMIAYKMNEERKALVSLIYILENYVELKQQSPFELNIPKQLLTETIEKSFSTIKELITQNVIQEMGLLRNDLQGEMVDVGTIVEKNMTKFDSQIQEAVTKVMWKVKTDVENTNMEDIKRTLLFILNKRSASYNLGGAASAILGIMSDDLERRLIQTGFKLENIKEYQKYTTSELTYKLGYKGQSNVIKAISLLIKRKLVKIYENKTISL